jgi:hypothetical protein
MSSNNLGIYIADGSPLQGVPFPDEDFDPNQLTDPEEFRNRLGAQKVARRLLPCIDTRASHWRYYLFAAPSNSPGRPIEIRKRLDKVLVQTQGRLAGIGRRDHDRLERDGRRSHDRFLRLLETRYKTAYGPAAEAFWGTGKLPDHNLGKPSEALGTKARSYVLNECYQDFFDDAGGPDQLHRMFQARLIRFRPGLASLIISKKYRLDKAAAAAAASAKLNEDDRLLFFSWAVLQAYYKIADDGRDPELDDTDGEYGPNPNGDEYYRTLARASLDLLDRLRQPGSLTPRQRATIRSKLETAYKSRTSYQPPVTVWKLTSEGTKRRVFSSLRLFAFTRLLRATRRA